MDLIISIFSGLGTGIVLSLMLGTVFFALLKDGLKHGYKAGIAIGLGVILTDIIFIFLAFAFTEFTASFLEANKKTILILSGIFIVLLGIAGFFGGAKSAKDSHEDDFNFFKSFIKGVILNGSNPVNFFAWLSLQSVLISQEASSTQFWSYFAACLIAIFSMELIIANLAKVLANKLNDKVLRAIKTTVNIVFIAIGLVVVYKGF